MASAKVRSSEKLVMSASTSVTRFCTLGKAALPASIQHKTRLVQARDRATRLRRLNQQPAGAAAQFENLAASRAAEIDVERHILSIPVQGT